MKQVLKRLLTATLLLTVLAGSGFAGRAVAVDVFQPCDGTAAASSAACKDADSQKGSGENPIVNAIKVVVQVLALVIGIASVIIIIVSGLRMVTSAGDAQGAATARNGILYAVIGLIIAALAQVLVAFVLNKL